MGESSSKKRKRAVEEGGKPKKKVVIDAPASTAKITSVLRPQFCPPVIVTAPGLALPKNLEFHSYVRQSESAKKSKQPKYATDTELLLHSTSHHNLDYTAREERHSGSKPLLNHFLGIFDPKTGDMQVIEAKKMIVRGTVRAKQASAESMGRRDAQKTMMDRRADLGQTFGTRKAKKALEDTVLNAIAPRKQPGDNTPSVIDDATRAVLGSVGETTSTMASRDELQQLVDAAKPGPQADLEAEEIQDVYDPREIIGGDVLNLIPIREWQEKAKHKDSIQVLSRYVAARVNAIATNEDSVMQLRVLRYLYFVLLFFMHTKPGRQRGTRQLPPRDKLKEALDPAPEAVVENIRRKFSDAGTLRKFHINSLIGHCCVFACIVDNFEVDTQNLRDDLKIDQKTMNQYFHEIGARVKPVTNKSEKRTAYVARLTLPLQFPKQRQFVPKRR